jgi:hypothetical protein
MVQNFHLVKISEVNIQFIGITNNNRCLFYTGIINKDFPSEKSHRSPTRQKQEEKKFGEYVCVRTRQSDDQTS